jgi:hypothetical protein
VSYVSRPMTLREVVTNIAVGAGLPIAFVLITLAFR